MINLIRNMKISRAILLVALVPFLVAIFFSSQMIIRETNIVSQLKGLEQLTNLSVKMATLVHEQQKERGATAVFVGSLGGKFRTELLAQRVETNKRREELKVYLESFKPKNYDEVFNQKYDAWLAELAKLDELRQKVDELSVSAATAIKYYTDLNAQNLDLIGYMASLSPDPEVVVSIVGYTNFMQGKERSGVERAVGASGFASGKFEPSVLDRFKNLVSAQQTYNAIFLSYATDIQKKIYDEVMGGDAAKEVERMRGIAIEGGLTSDLKGIQGSYWFDAITQKINGLKRIEDSLASDLMVQMAEIKAAAAQKKNSALVLTTVALLGTLFLSFLIIRAVNASFSATVSSMTELAEGRLDMILPPVTKNEIGDMVKAMHIFQQNGIERKRMQEEQEIENQAKLRRAEKIEKLIAGFDSKSSDLLKGLAAAATQMEATSQSMSAIAEETTKQATAVASAATQAGANVQNVASATEELTASIQDIARQVNVSGEKAKVASGSVVKTQEIMDRLSNAAGRIGEVIELITGIAEQTNLLALNATIESARAGEAGKGFAVVANEVKTLATETQKATDEIASVIKSVQTETQESVAAIQGISRIVAELTETSTAIAAAMEEQTAATREISRNVQEASTGTGEVSNNISGVSNAAQESGKAANEVLDVARKLAQQSQSMKGEVETFLREIRSA